MFWNNVVPSCGNVKITNKYMSVLKTQRKTSIHVVHCSVQIEINVIWNDEPPSTILFWVTLWIVFLNCSQCLSGVHVSCLAHLTAFTCTLCLSLPGLRMITRNVHGLKFQVMTLKSNWQHEILWDLRNNNVVKHKSWLVM